MNHKFIIHTTGSRHFSPVADGTIPHLQKTLISLTSHVAYFFGIIEPLSQLTLVIGPACAIAGDDIAFIATKLSG